MRGYQTVPPGSPGHKEKMLPCSPTSSIDADDDDEVGRHSTYRRSLQRQHRTYNDQTARQGCAPYWPVSRRDAGTLPGKFLGKRTPAMAVCGPDLRALHRPLHKRLTI